MKKDKNLRRRITNKKIRFLFDYGALKIIFKKLQAFTKYLSWSRSTGDPDQKRLFSLTIDEASHWWWRRNWVVARSSLHSLTKNKWTINGRRLSGIYDGKGCLKERVKPREAAKMENGERAERNRFELKQVLSACSFICWRKQNGNQGNVTPPKMKFTSPSRDCFLNVLCRLWVTLQSSNFFALSNCS